VRLQKEDVNVARNAGAGLDSDHVWFNQAPAAPLAEFKKAWFRSSEFRNAISFAINREDICRLVFGGYAKPAYGPVSPANLFWFNAALPTPKFDPQHAISLLTKAGFRLAKDDLYDQAGNRVEFTLVTNSGNAVREKIAAMIQEDLSHIGIKMNVVTLDFPSLIERMTRTFGYEACLLGLVNTELDPNGQMTVWLSSGENHQWNPAQKTPATAWEAEIDKLMREQASALTEKKRKEKFDRVQQIVYEQQPFIYLVNRDVLTAVSPTVAGAAPTVLTPATFWNIDVLQLKAGNEVGARR
jgi:peptide/nickel transport system substrate-binding protein